MPHEISDCSGSNNLFSTSLDIHSASTVVRADTVPSESFELNVGLHKSLYCCCHVVNPSFTHCTLPSLWSVAFLPGLRQYAWYGCCYVWKKALLHCLRNY